MYADDFNEYFDENYTSPRDTLITWMANHLGMSYNEDTGHYEKENEFDY